MAKGNMQVEVIRSNRSIGRICICVERIGERFRSGSGNLCHTGRVFHQSSLPCGLSIPETVTGSHLKKEETCLTEKQRQKLMEESQQQLRNLQRPAMDPQIDPNVGPGT